ncbi:hypothetical protein JXO52_17195 [bacterium]|nr:hypothetical protein [bacterium]
MHTPILRTIVIVILAAAAVLPGLALAQSGLSAVQVVPDESTVGLSGIHTISFTTSHAIPADGRIIVIYPSGFDVSNVSIASSTTINGTLTVTKSGNTITVIRSGGTATIEGANEIIKLANVRNVTVSGTYSILVQTRTVGAIVIDSGTFGQYVVNPGDFDNFGLSYIPTPQTAGVPLTATVTARDRYNNTVTNYSAATTLTDLTGTASPSQISFINGVWSGSVTITGTRSGNVLTATGAGKSSSSNQFTVTPASIDHFSLEYINSPVTAGANRSITILAKDQYGNTATGFSGIAFLSDETGTIYPATTGSFSQGTRIENIMITRADQDITISVTDGSGHYGTSNSFNVVHSTLTNFTIANVSDQAAGIPFPITVTARDLYGNTITAFSGTGNTVNISHSGSGAIVPTTSGDFTNGIWTGNVIVSQTQLNDRIQVTRTGGGQTGISNQFNISASSVDHFTISSIGATQIAGVPFPVTITAHDAANNIIDTFNGSANLFDETGSNTPSQFSFEDGSWTGNVTVTTSRLGNTLTVSSLGKSNSSNEFNVYADQVESFIIGQVATPQMAGVPFNLTITAVDQYGNTATDFSARVSIDDDTGTLEPMTSGYFSNGTRTEAVAITATGSDLRISVHDGASHWGESNFFNVISDTVDHFVVDISGNQIAGDPFTIHVVAEDQYSNIATGFTGTVNLSDLTGTVQPSRSSSFTSGQWTGNITIDRAVTGDVVSVTRTGGSETGSSQPFNLVEAPGIRVLQSIASQQYVTAGQDEDWTIKFAVSNLSANYATFDSINVKFLRYGNAQTDYTIKAPASFKNSGSSLISGNATDTLVVTVDTSGSMTGAIFIQGNIYCLDSNTGRTVHASGETGITLQDSARLDIYRLFVSQNQVTQGQDSVWTVSAVIQNSGEAVVRIDSAAAGDALDFSRGANWHYEPPSSLSGGGWDLSGGEADTLVFRIVHTGDNSAGTCVVHAAVSGTELNTGRTLSDDTQDHGSVSLLIEEKAGLQITGVKSMAPNGLLVNTSQDFYIRVKVRNNGGDAVNNLKISLQTNGYSIFPQSANGSVDRLVSGQVDSVDILVRASTSPAGAERFTAHAEGYAENTGQLFLSAASAFDYIYMTVQYPARLVIPRMVFSTSNVVAGQVDPWLVKAVVRNTGEADLVLEPEAADVSFWSAGLRQSDYIVQAPTQLSGGGLLLSGGETDTLQYRVTTTGRLGGAITVRARAHGIDQNSGLEADTTGSGQITVQAETDFRIISTSVVTANITDAGNGVVNTNQDFQVKVIIENGLGETIRDIRVRLQTDGSSTITQTPLTITRVLPSRRDSVYFTIYADDTENPSGETFTAAITAALLDNSGYAAPVGDALDRTASVIIQSPALLEIDLELSNAAGHFSANQSFWLKARLHNQGTGAVDDSGVLSITLPQNYILESGSPVNQAIESDSSVIWYIRAPMEPHTSARTVQVEFKTVPKAVNTGAAASVVNMSETIDVQTVETSLSSNFTIWSPAGATDGVLSTGQYFVVRAFVQWRNVNNIEAELILPAGYEMSDVSVKSVISPDVFWQIKAPASAAGSRLIKLDLTGYDVFQPEREVKAIQKQIYVTTVPRASLELSVTTSDNSVSLGQEFLVTASVTNNGTADTSGVTRVSLEQLPSGYTTYEPLTKTMYNGENSWIIRAPGSPTREAVNIVGTISTIPKDENTNETAYVSRSTDKVALTTVGAWLAIHAIDVPDTLSGIVLPGQENVWLGAMKFSNRGETGANGIVISSLKFDVEDRYGNSLAPASALQSLRLVGMRKTGGVWQPDPSVWYGSLSSATFPASGSLTLPVTSQLNIDAGDTAFVALQGTIAQSDTVPEFVLNIKDQSYIVARDEYSPSIAIEVLDVTGSEFFNYRSFRKQILPRKVTEEDKIYLINCPNPFGQPGKEETVFVYYLDEETDITFTIVTLTGETVWTAEYVQGDPQTRAGLHALGAGGVTWDGSNGAGFPVLNGVYVAFMQTGGGKQVSTKVAVLR